MGFVNSLLGNASEFSADAAHKEYSKLLTQGESVQKYYKVFRDSFIFTDRRLIIVDVQGLTGKKIEYKTIPYKSIKSFSIETAGHFDLDAELKIWLNGDDVPIQKKFNKQLDIYELQAVLAHFVLR